MGVEVVQDVPEGVIHLRIGEGRLTKSDYEDVIEPAIDAAGGERVRMLVDVDHVPRMEFGALGDDLKLGWRHRSEWDRIATVGDSDTVRRLSTWFSPLTPGKVRGFRTEERAKALAWLTDPTMD